MKKKTKYKIIFSDLDHTLLVNDHIPDFNLEAIKRAKEKGVKFVLCTGRNFKIMKHLLGELNTENSENEYSICNSGSLIYENKNAKVIYSKPIEFEILKLLFEYGKKLDVIIMFDTITDEHFIYNEIKIEESKWKSFKSKPIKNIEDLKDKKINRIYFTIKDKDELNKTLNEIKIIKC